MQFTNAATKFANDYLAPRFQFLPKDGIEQVCLDDSMDKKTAQQFAKRFAKMGYSVLIPPTKFLPKDDSAEEVIIQSDSVEFYVFPHDGEDYISKNDIGAVCQSMLEDWGKVDGIGWGKFPPAYRD